LATVRRLPLVLALGAALALWPGVCTADEGGSPDGCGSIEDLGSLTYQIHHNWSDDPEHYLPGEHLAVKVGTAWQFVVANLKGCAPQGSCCPPGEYKVVDTYTHSRTHTMTRTGRMPDIAASDFGQGSWFKSVTITLPANQTSSASSITMVYDFSSTITSCGVRVELWRGVTRVYREETRHCGDIGPVTQIDDVCTPHWSEVGMIVGQRWDPCADDGRGELKGEPACDVKAPSGGAGADLPVD
jgi:hypothetical protein